MKEVLSALKSCFECAAGHYCHDRAQNPVEARQRARSCTMIFKGRSTEVIPIRGFDKGISLKRALAIIAQGWGSWSDQGELILERAVVRRRKNRTKIVPLRR